MKTYALDTNIVSYYLKNNLKIINRVDMEKNDNGIDIPPLVYYEIKNWLLKNNSKKKMAIFERMYSYCGINYIDKNILDIASGIKIQLEKRGITIGDNDILIAAYCLKHNLILITNNTKHFENIGGLATENWTKE
jgi:tRNA(fMet)-specific endonuclease VapC